jgi:hypothetical protein
MTLFAFTNRAFSAFTAIRPIGHAEVGNGEVGVADVVSDI